MRNLFRVYRIIINLPDATNNTLSAISNVDERMQAHHASRNYRL